MMEDLILSSGSRPVEAYMAGKAMAVPPFGQMHLFLQRSKQIKNTAVQSQHQVAPKCIMSHTPSVNKDSFILWV